MQPLELTVDSLETASLLRWPHGRRLNHCLEKRGGKRAVASVKPSRAAALAAATGNAQPASIDRQCGLAAALAAACGMSPELRLSDARSTARAGGGLQSDRHGRIEVVDRSCAHGGNRSNCPWTAPKPNAVALAAGQAAEPLPRKAGRRRLPAWNLGSRRRSRRRPAATLLRRAWRGWIGLHIGGRASTQIGFRPDSNVGASPFFSGHFFQSPDPYRA